MITSRLILPCPACLKAAKSRTPAGNETTKRKIDWMLSVVCNMWPMGTVPADLEACCCGHPWLETAREDHDRWLDGETDTEREERRGYPTITEWRGLQVCDATFTLDEKSMRQAEGRMHRRPVTNDQSDSVSRSMKPSGDL